MSKSKSTKRFPYDELHELAEREGFSYQRTSTYLAGFSIFLILILPLMSYFVLQFSLEQASQVMYIAIALVVGIQLFLWAWTMILNFDNNKLIRQIVIEFDKKPKVFTALEIDTVAERSKVGISAGQIRTLLPLSLIPLIMTFMFSNVAQTNNGDMYLVALPLLFVMIIAYRFFLS